MLGARSRNTSELTNMNTPPDKKITMTFHSHPTKHLYMRWKMQLHFPPGASAETIIPITVIDGEGKDVDVAVLEFAGKRIRIKDGKGELSYADFIAGKHAKAIWLYRHGILPIPGMLTFE